MHTIPQPYEQAVAGHVWDVPERYNIAQDVCDKHPPDKPAMLFERFDGHREELAWGDLQRLANQAAHVLREAGIEKGDRVAVVLPQAPPAGLAGEDPRDGQRERGALRRLAGRARARPRRG